VTTTGAEHLGEIIEGYQLEGVLGSGSASVVYRAARVSDPDTVVAIKLLTFHEGVSVGDRASFRTRFLREARSTSKLKHDHIVP
jgi:serine/threonine protein kinase